MEKLLSIIIPAYNVEKYIEKCILSITNQIIGLEDRIELIIVIDGSPDKSEEIARKLLANVSFAKIISQQNKGLGGARNTGIDNSQGKYIWFVDSDDWITPYALNSLMPILCGDTDIISICAKDSNSNNLRNEIFEKTTHEMLIKSNYSFCAPFYIFNRLFLNHNNLYFKEHLFHEDNEFTPRALYLASSFIASNLMLYNVYINPTSITRSTNYKKSFDLIKVAKSLSDFSESNIKSDKKLKMAFSSIISLALNSAFHNIIQFDKKIQRDFNNALLEHKNLLGHFIKSGNLKYNIEGILYYFSFGNFIKAYKLLAKCYR